MAELIGKTFGNYRIEACLGRGGMAQVYQAQHLFLSRKVAIKIMFENLAADERFQARFHQEANTIAMLKHPNIVEIYDFGNADGSLYLVMELMRAGSLRTLLERERSGTLSLSLETWLDLIRQVAEGLDFAHKRGMVHRDIKPDNFLLDPIPGQSPLRYRVKISDFGLVRLREGGVKTTPGFLMGTPAYMSPEQCEATRELDARSDIYSLGVVLYEVVTGRMPFEIRTPAEAITKHLFHHPLPPRDFWPDLPKDLEGIILRCLVKDPAQRYASAMELARDLSALVESGRYADLRRSAVLPSPPRSPSLPQEAGSSSPASGVLSGSSSNAWEETISLVSPSDGIPIGTPQGTPARSNGAISEKPTGSLHQGWHEAMPSDVPPGNAAAGRDFPQPSGGSGPSSWRGLVGSALEGGGGVSSRTARALRPRIGGIVVLSLLFLGAFILLLRWEDFPRRREAQVEPMPEERAREAPPPPPSPSAPPRILSWTVSPAEITPGGEVTLQWRVAGADRVLLEPLGEVPNEALRTLQLTQTTEFRLVAINERGQTTEVRQVTVLPPRIDPPRLLAFSVEPSIGIVGEDRKVRISWATRNAEEIRIEPGIGRVEAQGQREVDLPPRDTTYTLIARNDAGKAIRRTTLRVFPPVKLLEVPVEWETNVGTIPFGRIGTRGGVHFARNVLMSNGKRYPIVLETRPARRRNGFIAGTFTLPIIVPGHHFRATVGFRQLRRFASTNGVTVKISVNGKTLYANVHTYGGTLDEIDIDLSPFQGKAATLRIEVGDNGDYTYDWFCWIRPRIERVRTP